VGRAFLKATSAINPFQDEAAGLLEGLGAAVVPGGRGFKEAYVEARDAARAPVHEFEREHPKTALGLDIAGALTPVPGPGKVKAVGQLKRLVTMAGRGAVQGAAYSLGAAEGDALQQGLQTGVGAGLGSVIGAGVGTVGERLARAKAGRVVSEASDEAAKAMKPAARTLEGAVARVKPGDLPLEGMGRAGRGVAVQVADQAGDDIAEQLVKGVRAEAAKGPDDVLVAASAVLQRPLRDPNDLQRTIKAAAKALGPDFDVLMQEPITLTDEMKEALTSGSGAVRASFQRGRAIAKERFPGIVVEDYMARQPGATIFQKGSLAIKDAVPLRTLHIIKMGLDDLSRPVAEGAPGLSKQTVAAVTSRLVPLREATIRQLDAYGDVLEKYETEMTKMEVLNLGLAGFGKTAKWNGRLIRVTPEELQRIHAQVKPEVKPYLSMGLLESLRKRGSAKLSPEHMAVLRALAPAGTQALEQAMDVARERGITAKMVESVARIPPGQDKRVATGVSALAFGAQRTGGQHLGKAFWDRPMDPEIQQVLADYLLTRGSPTGTKMVGAQRNMNLAVKAGGQAGRLAGVFGPASFGE
jgi:hypothetical protein